MTPKIKKFERFNRRLRVKRPKQASFFSAILPPYLNFLAHFERTALLYYIYIIE